MFSPQGCTFTWGTTALDVTSLQVNASHSGGEIDITSMSSEVVTDAEDQNRRLIVRDVDYWESAKYGTDVSVDFFAKSSQFQSNWFFSSIGKKKRLTVTIPSNSYYGNQSFTFLDKTAALTAVTLGASVGELVKGSATFKISGM